MGFDDLKISAIALSLFAPVLAQAATSELPSWALALKELGSVLAVIYLLWYTLTRIVPQMQERFTQNLASVLEVNKNTNDRILDMLERKIDDEAT